VIQAPAARSARTAERYPNSGSPQSRKYGHASIMIANVTMRATRHQSPVTVGGLTLGDDVIIRAGVATELLAGVNSADAP